jgi:hypothetical protein
MLFVAGGVIALAGAPSFGFLCPPGLGGSIGIAVIILGIAIAIFHMRLAASITQQVGRYRMRWVLALWSNIPESWLRLLYLLLGLALMASGLILEIRT